MRDRSGASPTKHTPTPHAATTRGDFIWWATANHTACPECGAVTSGSHSCKPKLAARAIPPRTVAQARGLLADTERTLARPNVHGTRRWRLTLRAQSARALVTAGSAA
jgi:hypothetical protein